MSVMAILALLVAWVLGALIVISLWSRERSWREDAPVILPLAFIVGLGATSVTFFSASLLSARPALLSGAIEMAGAFALLWYVRSSGRLPGLRIVDKAPTARAPHPRDGHRFSWLELVLVFVFVQTAVVAALLAWRAYQAEPFGGWDGWTIWNMHARFMLRAGTRWPELLSAAQLNWTHPDYPRLVPASVARAWGWTGDEAPFAAALVSTGFAVATVALLIAAIAKLRGRGVALAGGLLLLGTPFFVTFTPNQHADIPLASFMLAAVTLAALANGAAQPQGGWALAGICTAGAAWTKNEGLLFALLFAAAAGLQRWRTRSVLSGAAFFVALVVALMPLLYFKLRLAPANDLMAAPLGPRVAQLFEPSRHMMILTALGRDFRGFGEWRFAPWLAMVLPFLAWRSRTRLTRAEWLVPSALGLMLIGYYCVYLLSPHELAWHLDTSLVRLLLQLWPLAILAWCLAVPPLQSKSYAALRMLPWLSNRALFVAANCVVATVSLGALSKQRAANELVVRRMEGAAVSVTLTDGWFPIERHRRDEWAWSSGAAKLTLHVDGRTSLGSVMIRFGLRSAGDTRNIIVRERGHVLWQGAVTGELTPVEISNLRLEPGLTALEFSTDTPGVAESVEHGGRTLAFALFNLRLN
jgi:hypothetical protein